MVKFVVNFGQSGIKYLGSDTWEAKVSGKQRLFGKTVEKDGKKFIVFDTYSPKGLHRSK
ncbi:hypothetical protein ACQUW5_06110 [Legionella sp. CNM-1927-20]|uniref:hypothetical protein n=1 Tax=Legionella sp. CNM-1927-20 TaxID=3422221 RepID=UPI00403B0520